MASDMDRKRGKAAEEAGVRRVKRARLEEEGTNSEQEFALHPSDEDMFSLPLAGKDNVPSELSPDSYLSSDGGSFQLTKTAAGEGPGPKEEKKRKERKYRVPEDILEAGREQDRKERDRKSEERKRRQREDKDQEYRSSSARESSRGERERREPDDRRLLYPPDERYYLREYRRGDRRREEYPPRKGGSIDVGRWRDRPERQTDERYKLGHRHSTSPRPSDIGRLERRGSQKIPYEREGQEERREREREILRSDKARYERDRPERKGRSRKRRRSQEEREERRERKERMEREANSGSEEGSSGKNRSRSPEDKIEDWIKELEGEASGSQDRPDDDSSSAEERRSSGEDNEEQQERRNKERSSDHSTISEDSRSDGEIKDSSNRESSADQDDDRYSPQVGLTRSQTEPVLRSKFDDSSDSLSSDEESRKPEKKPSVGFAPRPQTAYSGYTEVVSGSSGESDVETREISVEILPKEGEVSPEKQEALVVAEEVEEEKETSKLPPYLPALMGCRNVEEYEWLNRIEEGTYGVVYRARDKRTNEVVALKKLKMEKEKEGFPITSLREINMLLKAKHPNIVHVRELVVGSNMDRIYIVMDYVEHDLKALMETMKQPFLEGEVKTLLLQLLRAVHHLHDNWILHRDLKTSNLLLSHKGILKVGDFGLAREYGSPLKQYTPVVVTLWYRAPELLLGGKTYSTPIDMWSVGCIFAEFLQHKPIFMGKSEIDQLNQIFKELGTPSEEIWTGYNELPIVKKVTFTKQPYNNLRKRFPYLTQSGFDLLNKFLTYDPTRRITGEISLEDPYFKESPLPVDPSMFPTWPAKSEKCRRKSREKSPTPPAGGNYLLSQAEEDGFKITSAMHGKAAVGAGFSLKF